MTQLDLSGKSDRDLLIQAVSDIAHLRTEFDKVSNGVGFPRCAERGVKIKDLQDDVKDLQDEKKAEHSWMKYGVVGGIFLIILTEVVTRWLF